MTAAAAAAAAADTTRHIVPPSASLETLRCDSFDMNLTASDIESLEPGGWFTDDIIDFYFRYLKRKYFNSDRGIVFVPVQLATLLTDRAVGNKADHLRELAADANALDFETHCLQNPKHIKVAFLPIFGDHHWSLLVYRVRKNKPQEFLHFNSYLQNSREQHTQSARTALTNLLYVLRENDRDMAISKDSYQLVIKNCPQQMNTSDCGVYVCMFAYILSKNILAYEKETAGGSLSHLMKRMSLLPANHSVRPDEIPFQRKAGKHGESDPAELMWKIKDRDELPPDNMRDYLYKIIRHECNKPLTKTATL